MMLISCPSHEQLVAELLGAMLELGGNVLDVVVRAQILLVGGQRPHERLHLDDVDHAGVVALGANG